jgi:hypothetical protein
MLIGREIEYEMLFTVIANQQTTRMGRSGGISQAVMPGDASAMSSPTMMDAWTGRCAFKGYVSAMG